MTSNLKVKDGRTRGARRINAGSAAIGPRLFQFLPNSGQAWVIDIGLDNPRAWVLERNSGWRGHGFPEVNLRWCDDPLVKRHMDVPPNELDRQPPPRPSRHMLTWAQAMKEYLPDDIRRIIAKFPPVNGLHFVLMNLVARCRGTEGQDYDPGRELLGSSAGLAVAVAYHWLFQGGRKARKDKWRIARRLLKMKRRQVAEYLHLEPRVLGVLAKLRPEAARPSRIFYINTAMADPSSSTCKALSHAPRPLGAGLCFLLTDPRLLAASTPSLISELAGVEKQVPHHPIVMRDALDLCEERGLRHRFKSIQDIHTVHRELTEDTIGRLKSSALINRSYLEPLAPGGEVVTEGGSVVVEPIVDRYGLHAEALLMKHCVASAEARIVAHESSIYSIVRRNADHEEVERATLEVRNGTDGPRLVQLKGKMNRAPTRALRIGINKWAAGVAHDRDWETLSEAQKVDRRGLLLDEDWDELGDNDVPY